MVHRVSYIRSSVWDKWDIWWVFYTWRWYH